MFNTESKYQNDGRMELEGAFNLNASAAVLNITAGTTTKTCTGQGVTVAKTGTGTYTATIKTSNQGQGPVFQAVEILNADAAIIATTVATALGARVASVTLSTAGDIVITILTTQTTGAAADTTAAITVCFNAMVAYVRMDSPI